MTAARQPVLDLISHSTEQTRRFGALVGRMVRAGDLILTSGPLGAGKTALIQGVASGLAVQTEVRSPTFTLIAEHDAEDRDGAAIRFYHVDLYRLDGSDDLDTVGLEEYLEDESGFVAVEWPQRAPEWFGGSFLLIELERIAESKRRIVLYPHGKRYEELAEQIRSEVSGGR